MKLSPVLSRQLCSNSNALRLVSDHDCLTFFHVNVAQSFHFVSLLPACFSGFSLSNCVCISHIHIRHTYTFLLGLFIFFVYTKRSVRARLSDRYVTTVGDLDITQQQRAAASRGWSRLRCSNVHDGMVVCFFGNLLRDASPVSRLV